jgi:hypothetical protein
VIVFMASRRIDVRLFACELLESFVCQITAAYWILGLITWVYSLLTYLNGAPHVILAILDIVNANFVSFLVTCSI